MSEQKQNYFYSLLVFLKESFFLLKGFRRFFISGFVLLVISESLYLFSQYLFKDIIDFLPQLQSGAPLTRLFWLVGAMAGCYFITTIVEYFNVVIISKAQIRAGHALWLKVFGKLMDLSVSYHEKQNTGGKISKIESGLDRFRSMIDDLYWEFAPTFIRVIVSSIFLFTIDYRIAIAFLAVLPFYVFVTIKMNKKLEPVRKDVRDGYESVYGKLSQAIYNIKTVQLFAQESEEKKRAKFGVTNIIKNQIKWTNIAFRGNFIRSNFSNIGLIFIIGFGSYLVINSQITLGELVLFLTMSFSCYNEFYRMTRIFDHIMDAKVSVERIMEILDCKEEVKSSPTAVKLKLKGKIEFRDVSFAYKDTNVLDDIELTIEPGEVIALVGPSGGGKTTLAKLLYRYYDVSHGGLFIDGIDIRKINLKHYRKQLGMVSQDIDVFDDRIKDNIAYGDTGASLSKIKSAARAANADEFIGKLPEKYDTLVGERGVKLSGGQRQRIGIARALLVDPKILIFDEATSSLDAESERKIQQATNRLIRGRTTIIIAHRLSTIKSADRIVVIDQGRIAEIGTHEQLLGNCGVYSKLVKLQVSGYLRE